MKFWETGTQIDHRHKMDFVRSNFAIRLLDFYTPWADAVDLYFFPRQLIAKCWDEWQFAIHTFASNFLSLAFFACTYILCYLLAHSFPPECSLHRIDVSCNTRMVEVAVVPFDDAGLKSWRYPDEFVICDNFMPSYV